jgi:hypothetical protein
MKEKKENKTINTILEISRSYLREGLRVLNKKINFVVFLCALSVLCVRIICWVRSGFKQQKTQCLRGLCVRKMVVWDGV